jgi:lipid-A-disaccharide synthase-like uncharacterized protein
MNSRSSFSKSAALIGRSGGNDKKILQARVGRRCPQRAANVQRHSQLKNSLTVPDRHAAARWDSAALPSAVFPASVFVSASAVCRPWLKLRIMDWLTNLTFHDGKFHGIEWGVWKVVGWAGNAVFFSRFFVQWYATEKHKRVVVPTAFWWLSLTGSLLLLIYSVRQRDSVFIFAYLFTWIPYIRNLIIHYRHTEAHLDCPGCGNLCAPQSNFCSVCGTELAVAGEKTVS